jgi:hypothetical protein
LLGLALTFFFFSELKPQFFFGSEASLSFETGWDLNPHSVGDITRKTPFFLYS